MKKNTFLLSLLTLGIFGFVGALNLSNSNLRLLSSEDNFVIRMNSSSNKIEEEYSSSGDSKYKTLKTSLNNDVTFFYSGLTHLESVWDELLPNGYINNYKTPLNGMGKICIEVEELTSSLKIEYSFDSNFTNSRSLEFIDNRVEFDFDGYEPNFFKLTNTNEENVKIVSIDIYYSCSNMYRNLSLIKVGKGSVMGAGVYKVNSSVTIYAYPQIGSSTFVGWFDSNDNLVSSNSEYTFIFGDSDLALTARFENV